MHIHKKGESAVLQPVPTIGLDERGSWACVCRGGRMPFRSKVAWRRYYSNVSRRWTPEKVRPFTGPPHAMSHPSRAFHYWV